MIDIAPILNHSIPSAVLPFAIHYHDACIRTWQTEVYALSNIEMVNW